MPNKPHDLISSASALTGGYMYRHNKEMDIALTDTGVIVAMILYFLTEEPNASMTKLECYLLLLNKKYLDASGEHLFLWKLSKSGRIRNFKKMIEHMVSLKVISHGGGSLLIVERGADGLKKNFKYMFDGVLGAMKDVLKVGMKKTAKEMLSLVTSWKEDAQYRDALENANKAIDGIDGAKN